MNKIKIRHKESSTTAKGFTLIELLVVIAIIALLAVIVIASLEGARTRSKNTKKNEIAMQYINALELYRTDKGAYPNSDTNNPTYYNCLGYPTGEKCHPLYEGLDSLNDEKTGLGSFYETMPKADDFSVELLSGSGIIMEGILYRKIDDENYILEWYLKEDFDCPRGSFKQESTNGLYTQCTYPEEL